MRLAASHNKTDNRDCSSHLGWGKSVTQVNADSSEIFIYTDRSRTQGRSERVLGGLLDSHHGRVIGVGSERPRVETKLSHGGLLGGLGPVTYFLPNLPHRIVIKGKKGRDKNNTNCFGFPLEEKEGVFIHIVNK